MDFNAASLKELVGGSLATGLKGFTSRAPNNLGGQKLWNNFTGQADGGALLTTACMKFEAEAPFSAIRVWVGTWLANSPGPFIGVIAPTETMSRASANLAYQPQIGGAAFNTLVSAPYAIAGAGNLGPYFGWRALSWAGAANFTFSPAPGPTHADPVFKCSDIVPCRSVPRVDVTGAAAGRHAVMVRLYNSAGNRCNQDFTSYWSYTTGNPWHRDIQGGFVNSDAVTTLTNQPAAAPGTSTSNIGYPVWVEFFYDVPCRHVLNIGNSRQDTWPREILQFSTPNQPIAFTEMSMPGDNIQKFTTAYDNMVTQGLGDFTDIILQGYDRNSQFLSRKLADDEMATYTTYLRKFRQQNARVFMTTDYCENTNNAEAEAGRQRQLAWIRAMDAQGLVIMVDTDPIITDYTNVATPSMKAAVDFDGTHATAAAEHLMASQALIPKWAANT